MTILRFGALALIWFGVGVQATAGDWDIEGDLKNPGRIINNIKRETGKATKTLGDAVSKAAPVVAALKCRGCAILVKALPADEKKLVESIVSKGMVISTLGPTAGVYYLTVLSAPDGDVHQDDVQVQTKELPTIGKKYTVDFGNTACMVELTGKNIIQVYSKKKPSFWDEIKGATAAPVVAAKSAHCPEYDALEGMKSVTSVTLKISGASVDEFSPDDGSSPRYLFVGSPYSG